MPAQPYTQAQYAADAALISFTAREIEIGHYSNLGRVLTAQVLQIATAIRKVQPPRKRQLIYATILDQIHGKTSKLTDFTRFAEVVERF